MQDKRIVAFGLHQPGQVRLFDRRIDMRVAVVLENPEVPIQSYIDTRWLDQFGSIRIELDPPGLDLGSDVSIGEEHAGNLPGPVPCLSEVAADEFRGAGAGVVQWQNISFPS